jgi:hypothetical protein
MTESEWLTCTDANELLRFLGPKASERKLRLFAVACCRHISSSVSDRYARHAIKTSERYADGRATEDELEAAFVVADKRHDAEDRGLRERFAMDAARLSAHPETRGLADGTATSAAMANIWGGTAEEAWEKMADEQAYQCLLLRDIFGNPFRPVECTDHWPFGPVVDLASEIYDRRLFKYMPALGDRLKEAGCNYSSILDHTREPTPHVRGCWVLDLVLRRS